MAKRILRVKARPLIAALRALGRSGTRLPAYRLSGYTLALDTSSGRLYVTRRRRALGVIRVSGVFRINDRATKKEIFDVKTIVENPVAVARGVAILAGLEARCPFCNRVLDSKDKLRGIGRRCLEKVGWGEKKTNAAAAESDTLYERSEAWPFVKRKSK